jgi:hypothetical protein
MTPLDPANQDRVHAAKVEIAAAKADAAAAEHEASDARVVAKGFPFFLVDGTELLAVKKSVTPLGVTTLETEDGTEYQMVKTTGRYAAVDTAPAAPAPVEAPATEEE